MNNQGQGQAGKVDWNGLFNWSTAYHDGTAPASEFTQMSADDKKWLQEAMTQYTFDDTNKMKDIVEKLDEDLKSGFTKISKEGSDYSETADLVDQL